MGSSAARYSRNFIEVRIQPGDFLSDVTAVGKKGDLFNDALIIEVDLKLGFIEPAVKIVTLPGQNIAAHDQ